MKTNIEKTTVPEANIMQVAIVDKMDLYNAPMYKRELTSILTETDANIIVDLGMVEHMDSSGLGALVVFANEAKNKGRKAGFIRVSDFIKNLINISNLEKQMRVFDDVDAARDAWDG